MAKPGRKPRPTAVLKAVGDRRWKRRGSEPAFSATKSPPKPPAWMSTVAKAEWRLVAKELHTTGVLTVVDHATLEVYCQSFAFWRKAEKQLATERMTIMTRNGSKKNPLVQITRDAKAMMLRFAVELGITPSSRSRVTSPKQPDSGVSGSRRFYFHGKGSA